MALIMHTTDSSEDTHHLPGVVDWMFKQNFFILDMENII